MDKDKFLLTDLLTLSINLKASDLHLSPGQFPFIRVHGDLVVLSESQVLDSTKIKNLIYSIMDDKQKVLFEVQLDLDFAISLDEVGVFRINVFHHLHGISAVFRIIPTRIPELETLGLSCEFTNLLNLTSGLILITGSTGCGKSTTLATLIEHINKTTARHIITLEDPIEFIYQNKKSLIHQRQLLRDTTSFEEGLRAALREDPDVILVGEMRDLETIRLTLRAAETGHLVMATLHTHSAPRAVSRIIDVFPDQEKNMIRNLLSESIEAVICQRLVKKNTFGRVAAFEIMLATHAVRHLIREDKITQMYSAMQTGAKFGMCTMEQSLHNLVVKNIISDTGFFPTSF